MTSAQIKLGRLGASGLLNISTNASGGGSSSGSGIGGGNDVTVGKSAAPVAVGSKVKLLVLGASSVGKTAFVVRLITKRFIGDYDQNKETLYTHRLLPNGERDDVTLLEILDSANNVENTLLEEQIAWADGFVFIYSVADRRSFDFVERHLATVGRLRNTNSSSSVAPSSNGSLPMVIVGNKADCPSNARQVTNESARKLESVTGRVIREISVAEGPTSVVEVIDDVVKQVRANRCSQQFASNVVTAGSPKSPTRSTTTISSTSGNSSGAGFGVTATGSGSGGGGGADRMSSTLTNVRRVLRDKIYNRSRSDTTMMSASSLGK